MAKTSVVTPEATLSYPALFEPKLTPSGEEKYSCALIFDETADLSELKAAAREVATVRWGDKVRAMIRSKQLRMPFRDGAEKEGSRGYGPGKTFINCATTRAPGVVSRYRGKDGRPMPLDDPDELYPGCQVRASLTAFAYDTSGNRGVSFALNNIQKLGEGERLDGRLDPQDEFDAFEEEPPVDFEPDVEVDEGDDRLPAGERLRGMAKRTQRRRLRRDEADEVAPWD